MLDQRNLGALTGLGLGLGCMGMSFAYGPGDDEESVRVIHRAHELGRDVPRHRSQPRWTGENLEHNLALVRRVREVAGQVGATPVQVALAWLLANGDDVVPIPGTKCVRYLEDNAAAADVRLDDDVLAELNELGEAAGGRYSDAGLANVET